MEIRLRKNGNVVTESEFRRQNPNTSFPLALTQDILNVFGADIVYEGSQPSATPPYQYVYRDGIEVKGDGNYYTKYSIGVGVTATIDASAAANARSTRDEKLKASDWVTLKSVDTGVGITTAWKTYRQDLRDLPTSAGFPHSVTWPNPPA